MKSSGFILINFIVAFLSDVFLNDLTRKPLVNYHDSKVIKSLTSYFKDKSIYYSGILAAFTIIFALIVVMSVSKLLFGFWVPSTWIELLKFCLLAFPFGYLIDVLIDKLNIFGSSLDPYYNIAGAGLWGAVAFIFSIVISFIIQKYLLPKING